MLNAQNLCDVYHILLRNRRAALVHAGMSEESVELAMASIADALMVEVLAREEQDLEDGVSYNPPASAGAAA